MPRTPRTYRPTLAMLKSPAGFRFGVAIVAYLLYVVYGLIAVVQIYCVYRFIYGCMESCGWVPNAETDDARRGRSGKYTPPQLKKKVMGRFQSMRSSVALQRIDMVSLGFMGCATLFLDFLMYVLFGYEM
jgi:hypothetical protein